MCVGVGSDLIQLLPTLLLFLDHGLKDTTMANTLHAQLKFNTQVPPYNKGEVASWPYEIDQDTGKVAIDPSTNNKIHHPVAKGLLTKRFQGLPLAEHIKDIEVKGNDLATELAGPAASKANEINEQSNPQSKQNSRR